MKIKSIICWINYQCYRDQANWNSIFDILSGEIFYFKKLIVKIIRNLGRFEECHPLRRHDGGALLRPPRGELICLLIILTEYQNITDKYHVNCTTHC